jgi:hypothetical protein
VASALAHVVAVGGRARDVWLVYVGTGALDRAVLVRCRPGACETPRRIDDTALLTVDARDADPADTNPADTNPADTNPADTHPADTGPEVQALALARAWIDEAPTDVTPPEPSLVEAWWLWTAVGVAVVGAGVAIGVAATQPSGEAPLVLRFDPCTQCAR